MKIPKTLSIKGKEWTVEYKWSLKDSDGNKASGLCDLNKRIIYIDRLLAKDDKLWVFWHEYKHARLYESGLIKNTGGFSRLAEEITCDDFADFMTAEVKVRWIKKR